jgi:protein TonB
MSKPGILLVLGLGLIWVDRLPAPISEEATPTPEPAESARGAQNQKSKSKLVYSPSPKYPDEARASKLGPLKGSGRFRVIFSMSGETRNVEVVQSTGQEILDRAALSALRQWKSEHGHEWTIIVPIKFEP